MSKGSNVPESVIYICTGSKCKKRGSKDVSKLLKGALKEEGLNKQVEIIKTECTGRCKFAPVLSIQPANVWLKEFDEGDVPRILKQISL